MLSIHKSVILLVCYLTLVKCVPFSEDSTGPNGINSRANSLMAADSDTDSDNLDKRVERYAFGLGRRAYTYTAGGTGGVKRLPVYNFGLGKRARPYSFGLGKRAELDDGEYFDMERNNFESGYDGSKRNRPYSFGLGKRDTAEDVERRSGGYPQRYGFGLGRR